MMEYFVEGDSRRLFLNTRIGCSAKCSYCYLPMLNLNPLLNKRIQPDEIVNFLKRKNDFMRGKDGTIISIGCYSECWDLLNKEDTKLLLKLLLEWGNPIQLASKMEIKKAEIKSVSKKIQWENQLSIYISCPTLTNSDKYEIGAGNIQGRLKTIKVCKLLNIPTILYIKPVIKNITIRDLDKYIDIVEENKLSVVVGESFSLETNINQAPIGNGRLFCVDASEDQIMIVKKLSKYTNVYCNSFQVVESYRSFKI